MLQLIQVYDLLGKLGVKLSPSNIIQKYFVDLQIENCGGDKCPTIEGKSKSGASYESASDSSIRFDVELAYFLFELSSNSIVVPFVLSYIIPWSL
jgi:hypothetical protein